MTISGIRNPRSTHPTDNLEVRTYDSSGNPIARGGLENIKIAKPGVFDTMVITPELSINGINTKYAFEITTKIPVDDNDILTISFPETIKAPVKDIPCETGTCVDSMECRSSNRGMEVVFTSL